AEELMLLGAVDFIPKPFQSNEMQAKVDRILGEATLKKEENKVKGKDLEREFCKLPIEDFLTERDTEYGVFIRVSENKFIKIAHKGGKIPEDKVQSFKEKGVDYLYVQQEDFVRIVGFTVNLSKMVNESNKVDPAKKLRFIQYTGSMLAQQAYAKGMNEALFHNAKNFLASSMTVILDSPDIFDMLDQLSTHTDYLYAQSLSVSVLSVMMAKQMGIHSPQTLFKVALAGLFHDIGLREISPDILNKSRVRLNQVERALLETHCTRGKEILELMKGMPADVIQVTYEHHEDILGTGYPRRIDKNRIHPLTHIISTADAFIALTMKNPDNPVALESSYALSKLTSTRASLLEPQSLEALTALVVSHK
ncbi:MAG: HD domain-containing phosphohydrolase, partial [Bdellovibrio sp.]